MLFTEGRGKCETQGVMQGGNTTLWVGEGGGLDGVGGDGW